MEKADKKGLLDCIAEKTNCTYLSDLRYLKSLEVVKRVVIGIPLSDYVLEEWQDAVRYLTGTEKFFEMEESALEFLLNYEK